LKNLRKAIDNKKKLSDKELCLAYVLTLYAVDYFDLFDCIECYNPEFEDAMDDVLDYMYFICSEKDYEIGWVRLPIA